MAEFPSSAVPSLPGLAVEAVEWLPSGADSGLVRVRGRWIDAGAREPGLPALALRAAGGEHRFESLPDARFSRDPESWRGTYLVPAELVATDPEAMWLEWAGGARAGLPTLARGVEPPPVQGVAEPAAEEPDAGGQVIDRAVLAERRARRAEAAEESQARVAAEALKAVEVLELRSAELERRLEEATAERDALAARPEPAPADGEALAEAQAALADLRARARDLQLRLRSSELARSGDAVHLAVLQADHDAATTRLRAAADERAAELAAAHAEAESRAAALTSELGAARDEAAARADELDAARRDAAARTDELDAARRDAAARADELAALDAALAVARVDVERERGRADARMEEARAAWDRRRAELETALAGVREELTRAREAAGARVDGLETALADTQGRLRTAEAALAAAETRLRVETVARTTLEDELDRERTAWQADRTAIAELEQQASAARAERDAERSAAESLRTELASVRASLATAERQTAAAQAERDAGRTALADLRRELEVARAEVGPARAAAADAQEALASTRSELTGLSQQAEAGRSALERLHAELEDERRARAEALAEAEFAQAAAVEARTALASTRAAMEGLSEQAEVGREVVGRLHAELEAARGRPSAPPGAEQLERLARQQAEAAADRPPAEDAGRLVSDLDAAADALRRRTPTSGDPDELGESVEPPTSGVPEELAVAGESVEPPAEDRQDEPVEPGVQPPSAPVEPPPPPDPPASAEPAGTSGVPEALAVAGESVEPPVRPRIVSPSRPPARAHVVGTSRRDYPHLRGAIVKLAHDDPATAGRLLAALLPVHSAVLDESIAYDLTIREVGTFGITVAGTRTFVEPLQKPRGRSGADFHLKADALSLAELLAGVDHKVRRFFGPVRARGRRRRVRALDALPRATTSVTEAARAGAKLEPDLVYRAFAYAVHPSWTRGHRFTIEQEITGEGTWFLTARNGAGLSVAAAGAGPDATVTMSRATFDRLVRDEPVPRGERPTVKGDREAVALMRAWTERARG